MGVEQDKKMRVDYSQVFYSITRKLVRKESCTDRNLKSKKLLCSAEL